MYKVIVNQVARRLSDMGVDVDTRTTDVELLRELGPKVKAFAIRDIIRQRSSCVVYCLVVESSPSLQVAATNLVVHVDFKDVYRATT